MFVALTIALVMFGGALGAIARAIVQRLFKRYTSWPGWVAILVVNIAGSFIIGFSVASIAQDVQTLSLLSMSPSPDAFTAFELNELFVFLAVGFCGAFTTFSSFSLDTVILLYSHRGQAILNVFASTLLAFIAVAVGWSLGGGVFL